MKRFVIIVGLTILSVTSAALACVDPCNGRYCTDYRINGTPTQARQPLGRDGVARIPYYVNAERQQQVTEAELVSATKAAAATWERANANVDLTYKGTTATLPGLDDGIFVVGLGTGGVPSGSSGASRHGDGLRPDITLSSQLRFVSRPCDATADHSCSPVAAGRGSAPATGVSDVDASTSDVGAPFMELQDELTTMFGYALGLREVDPTQLTMSRGSGRCSAGTVCRERSTLGAGDILGIRALYPARCAPATEARAARNTACGIRIVVP